MHYKNQQRKKFKIKFQVLPEFAQILPDYAPLKIQVAYFSSWTPKSLLFTGKISRTDMSSTLGHFCLNLVGMATAFAPCKIQIPYLNSTTQKPYHTRKNCQLSYRVQN